MRSTASLEDDSWTWHEIYGDLQLHTKMTPGHDMRSTEIYSFTRGWLLDVKWDLQLHSKMTPGHDTRSTEIYSFTRRWLMDMTWDLRRSTASLEDDSWMWNEIYGDLQLHSKMTPGHDMRSTEIYSFTRGWLLDVRWDLRRSTASLEDDSWMWNEIYGDLQLHSKMTHGHDMRSTEIYSFTRGWLLDVRWDLRRSTTSLEDDSWTWDEIYGDLQLHSRMIPGCEMRSTEIYSFTRRWLLDITSDLRRSTASLEDDSWTWDEIYGDLQLDITWDLRRSTASLEDNSWMWGEINGDVQLHSRMAPGHDMRSTEIYSFTRGWLKDVRWDLRRSTTGHDMRHDMTWDLRRSTASLEDDSWTWDEIYSFTRGWLLDMRGDLRRSTASLEDDCWTWNEIYGDLQSDRLGETKLPCTGRRSTHDSPGRTSNSPRWLRPLWGRVWSPRPVGQADPPIWRPAGSCARPSAPERNASDVSAVL